MIAVYVGVEKEKASMKERFLLARQVIGNYPTLSKIFKGLEKYSEEIISNPVIATLSEAKSSVWCNGFPSQEAINAAQLLEKTLLHLEKNHDKILNKDFFDRLTAKDSVTCDSLLKELRLYMILKTRYAEAKVQWEPRIGRKRGDILFDGHCKVYIEITSLYESQIELDLKKLYKQTGEVIWKSLPNGKRVSIRISTDKLVWKATDGHLDIEASKAKILKDVDDLACSEFFKHNGISRFESLATLPQPDKPLLESLKYMEHYDEIGQFILQNSQNVSIQKFLQSVTPERIENSTICSCIAGQASSKAVELQSDLTFPSDPAYEEQRIFINRIITKLRSKKGEKQRKPNTPNILVVRAANWTIWGYSYDPDESIRDAEFELIKKEVQHWLVENPVENLTAVVLYETSLNKVRIIENPKVRSDFHIEAELLKKLFSP